MAVQAQLVLGQWQRLAGGHAQLPLDQVEPGDALGDRVLDLQPCIHLQEKVSALGIDDKLDRAGTSITHRTSGRHGICADALAHGGIDDRRRCLFDHLLASPLRGAVALAQVDAVAVGVGEHLHLDVAAALDQALQHERAVAEGAGRLAARAGQGLGQGGEVMHQPHAAAAAAGHRLHQQRQTQAAGLGKQRGVALVVAQVARRAGHAGFEHAALGQRLVAHGGDGRGRRADEDKASLETGLGELGALGQEAVARMHGIGAGAAGGVEQRIDAQVALGRGRLADAHRLVGLGDMRRQGISGAVDSHGAVAQGARRADHAASDFATVGDEDRVEHGWGAGQSRTQRGARFWR